MQQTNQRIAGIFGIFGGIILFIGDMLFYYDGESSNLLLNMANSSDRRIMISGATALFASWFYMIGLIQVAYAFKPAKPIFRNIVLFSLGSILISFGVVHGAYVAIATTAKVAAENGIELSQGTHLARETNNLLRLIVYPIFALLSFVFIHQVWKRKTLYPRWIIFFFPLFLFLIQDFFAKIVSGKWWVILIGGYLNIILIIFFTASTVALWNKKSIN